MNIVDVIQGTPEWKAARAGKVTASKIPDVLAKGKGTAEAVTRRKYRLQLVSEILTDQPGKTSWPITGASFVLMHKVQADPAKGLEVLKFFDWAFKNGQKTAEELDYVALPQTLVKQIDGAWRTSLKDGAGNPVLK